MSEKIQKSWQATPEALHNLSIIRDRARVESDSHAIREALYYMAMHLKANDKEKIG